MYGLVSTVVSYIRSGINMEQNRDRNSAGNHSISGIDSGKAVESSKEDSESNEMPEKVQVKRKRGRPPKIPRNNTVVNKVISSKVKLEKEADGSENAATTKSNPEMCYVQISLPKILDNSQGKKGNPSISELTPENNIPKHLLDCTSSYPNPSFKESSGNNSDLSISSTSESMTSSLPPALPNASAGNGFVNCRLRPVSRQESTSEQPITRLVHSKLNTERNQDTNITGNSSLLNAGNNSGKAVERNKKDSESNEMPDKMQVQRKRGRPPNILRNNTVVNKVTTRKVKLGKDAEGSENATATRSNPEMCYGNKQISAQKSATVRMDDGGKTISMLPLLRQDVQKVKKEKFTCHHCGKLFKTHKSIEQHMMVDHSLVVKKEKFTCHHCEKMFKTHKSIERHMMVDHSLVWSQEKPDGEECPYFIVKTLGQITCQRCRKKFRFSHYYRHHQVWCGRETEVSTCHVCEKKIRSMWLHNHLRKHKVQAWSMKGQELQTERQQKAKEGKKSKKEKEVPASVKSKLRRKVVERLGMAKRMREEIAQPSSCCSTSIVAGVRGQGKVRRKPNEPKGQMDRRLIRQRNMHKPSAEAKARENTEGPDTEESSNENYFLPVQCGEHMGVLHTSKFFCPGYKRACIEYQGTLITPKDFTRIGGFARSTEWKSNIFVANIKWLKSLMKMGLIRFQGHNQFCTGLCTQSGYGNRSGVIPSDQTNSSSEVGEVADDSYAEEDDCNKINEEPVIELEIAEEDECMDEMEQEVIVSDKDGDESSTKISEDRTAEEDKSGRTLSTHPDIRGRNKFFVSPEQDPLRFSHPNLSQQKDLVLKVHEVADVCDAEKDAANKVDEEPVIELEIAEEGEYMHEINQEIIAEDEVGDTSYAKISEQSKDKATEEDNDGHRKTAQLLSTPPFNLDPHSEVSISTKTSLLPACLTLPPLPQKKMPSSDLPQACLNATFTSANKKSLDTVSSLKHVTEDPVQQQLSDPPIAKVSPLFLLDRLGYGPGTGTSVVQTNNPFMVNAVGHTSLPMEQSELHHPHPQAPCPPELVRGDPGRLATSLGTVQQVMSLCQTHDLVSKLLPKPHLDRVETMMSSYSIPKSCLNSGSADPTQTSASSRPPFILPVQMQLGKTFLDEIILANSVGIGQNKRIKLSIHIAIPKEACSQLDWYASPETAPLLFMLVQPDGQVLMQRKVGNDIQVLDKCSLLKNNTDTDSKDPHGREIIYSTELRMTHNPILQRVTSNCTLVQVRTSFTVLEMVTNDKDFQPLLKLRARGHDYILTKTLFSDIPNKSGLSTTFRTFSYATPYEEFEVRVHRGFKNPFQGLKESDAWICPGSSTSAGDCFQGNLDEAGSLYFQRLLYFLGIKKGNSWPPDNEFPVL